jgi:DNA polymerase III delta prime subunit
METFLWVEQYRPKDVTSCILPGELKNTFSGFIAQGEIPNLLLHGSAGTGKTTVAKAMVEQIGCSWMMINGSEEGNIDTLRTTIKNFASTVSLVGGRKYLILDEADYLNPQSTQPALRGLMEEFSNNCGFILTCNYPTRIIPALHSRCSAIDFSIPSKEKQRLAGKFFERTCFILEEQEIKYEKKVVAEVINKYFPDWRRVLNELQRYAASGQIDAGMLVNLQEISLTNLMGSLKSKEFTNVREWVVDNLNDDPVRIFRRIYDSMYDVMDSTSIPHAVVIIGDYQYKSAFVADQEINMLACLTELMAKVKFK